MKINTMYKTISGEVGTVIPQGSPCLLIRTQGCNLRCSYCDAPETQGWNPYNSNHNEIPVDILLEHAKSAGLPVLLTGGEPLLQADVWGFINKCVERGISLQIETNGTISLDNIPSEVGLVVDWKFDDKFNVMFDDLFENDWVKFVVSNNKEIIFAKDIIKCNEESKNKWAISPTYGGYDSKVVSDFILRNDIHATLNIQLHKLIDMP